HTATAATYTLSLHDALPILSQALHGTAAQRRDQPPPAAVLDSVRTALAAATGTPQAADATMRLAEAIRVLALRHGEPALEHCVRSEEHTSELQSQSNLVCRL